MRKLVSMITAAVMCVSQVPQFFGGSAMAEEIWKPNPINAHEKLDRGLVAMMTDEGVYLSWRLQADEDSIYGTAKGNVSFDIYRDDQKIAVESYTTNYIDKEGTAASEYRVVRCGADKDGCAPVKAFESGSNYFEIPLDVPAAVTFPSDTAASDEAEEAEEDNTATGEEDDTSAADESGKHPYTVGDSSTGDLDGDGELEIVVKWDCSPKDNSHQGYTGNVILSAYKLNGTHMWDIDLGPNIRSGAHYTQFLVYDFDGDGKAEVTAKTAPGSKGGDGQFVTKAAKTDEDIRAVTDDENNISYVSNVGRILTGDEYFTIFRGTDGAALDTIYYPNQRLAPSIWGDADTYGNRVDRFNATVAYLDGEKPYAVYMRGYYYGRGGQRQAACAVSYDGDKLDCHLSFDTYDVNNYKDPSGYTTSSFRKKPYSARNYKGVIGYEEKYKEYVGQGNHNVNVADVDNDGRDEVLTGAMCYHIDENGNLRPLWSTFKGHGDAMHIGDYDPTHDGYEYFVVHEEGGGHYDHGTLLDYGMSLIDPGVETYGETGKAPDNIIAFHSPNSGDTGRGVMANVGSGGYYQFWGAGTRMSAGGMTPESFKNTVIPSSSSNFRIFWNGDLYDELLDNIGISEWDENKLEMKRIFYADGCTSVNGTKAVPALSADLFGDWREEVVFPTSDNTKLRVYTTDIYTEHKMKSLMYDNVYRCGVSAEQSGYNQPPHIGYYLDTGDNGEGKVNAAPTVTIPEAATKILHQNADSSIVKMYWDSLPEDIDGFEVTVNKADRTKYFAVVNQGLTNNVFKMVNGNYSTSNRAVSVDFSDTVKEAAQAAVEAGKYTELTFVVKLFNGTDGTTGALYFLSDTTANKNNTAYANKIATLSTNELPEGEWGTARYEFTGSEYNLYLNDEKIASGNTTVALPTLAMPFTNLSGNAPYTSMIFDDIYVYSIEPEAAPTPAPTPEPEPTAKPLGAAPAKTDTVLAEDFEKDTNIFGQPGKVIKDTAKLDKNDTNIFNVTNSSATSTKINGANKTKTYLTMDFCLDAGYINNKSAICLREGNNDIINIISAPTSQGRWGNEDSVTVNGIPAKNQLRIEGDSYGGWRDTTGWVTLYAAFDFDKQTADVSFVRKSNGVVLYTDTLDFKSSANALEYIYVKSPAAGGEIRLDNINISTDPEATLTDITVKEPDKTEYFTGEEFNTDGMTVTANYSDDTHYELTPYEYTVSETDMTTAGTKAVTVSYLGKESTFNITVKDKAITEISVVSEPSKARYLQGDELDTTGLALRADYDDGSYEIVTGGYNISGFDSTALGEKTVTVSYAGKSASFTVNVVNADELNPTPTPKPTARPKATPRPTNDDDETEPVQPVRTLKYTMALTDTSRDVRVTEYVANPTNTADASVPDFGSGTEVTASVPTLDGWGYKHYAYDGTSGRQTSAEYRADTNTFNVCGIGNGGGAAISFIPENVNDLALNDNAVQVYEFDAVVTTTGQNQLSSLPIGFTSSADGAAVSSVASVLLASSGQNNVEKTYKMVMVNDKINGKYYIYKDGIRMSEGDSNSITGIYAQTVNRYIKIGFRNLVMYEQDKAPIAVKVVFNGADGKPLEEYSSVLSGTSLTVPDTPILAGKTFKEWRDKSGDTATEFAAGKTKTVYNAYYEDGSLISSVFAYVDKFAKVTLQGEETYEKYADIYGIATFENIKKGVYDYKIEKLGYTGLEDEFTLGDDITEIDDALALDSEHANYLYYEADWTDGKGYITDGTASGFTTDLGATNVKLPTTGGVADVFEVTVSAKAENLTNDNAAATWLLNSDKGVLLGLHWAKDDGIYAITGWSGSAVPKATTDTLEKVENTVKIADSASLTDSVTVNFAVDAEGNTIVVSADGAVKGSLPMVNAPLSLNTMSAGVTNAADDIYVYTLAVSKPEDTFMAISGDTAVAKVSGASVARQYEKSEAKATEGEEFVWSLEAPDGAAANAVTLSQSGLLTIADTATAGDYIIKCQSNSNANKQASITVTVHDFASLNMSVGGPEVWDFRNDGEIKYTITSAKDICGAEVKDIIPSPVWSVSDTSVATINASTGVLTKIKPGAVTVTATVNNGGVISTESVELKLVNYYIITDATQNQTTVNISSLADDKVTAYRVTTADNSGVLKAQYTVPAGEVTASTLTIDTTGADKVEIAPVFEVSSEISKNTDERYTFNLPVGAYDISVTASGQRVDVYANNQMLVNNMLQHGSDETTETRNDIKTDTDNLTISTSDYASDKVNASWTTIKNITVVKSPEIVTRKTKMYVLGDSLVAKYYNGGSAENPLARSGWGQVLDNYITRDIEVVPLGNSGVTAQGLYKTAFTQIRESAAEGDYLILESGYNDKNYCTKAEMQEAIYGMYNEATAKGVKVILVSPNASYHDYRGNVAWTTYMEEFAENLGAEYIDLSQRSYDFLSETYGNTFSDYYTIYNVDDQLHSTYNAAQKWASLVAQGIYDLGHKDIVDMAYKYEYTDGENTQTAQVIKPALPKPEVTAPVGKDGLVYNDEVQLLLETGATSTGGTVLYSLDGESWFTDTVDVSAVDAGSYTVYYRVQGNEEFSDVDADTITVTIAKADRAEVEGVTAASVSAEGESDGRITGVNDTMEYRAKGGEYAAVEGNSIENLTAGDYEVRYAETGNYNAGAAKTVQVTYPISGTITWHYNYSYTTGNGSIQNGEVPAAIDQRSETAKVELLNRGEVYDTVTVTAETAAENTATGTYTFTNVPTSIDGTESSYTVRITPLVAADESDTEQAVEAQNYIATFNDAANRSADITYNPYCFDAEWTVNIAAIDTIDAAVPDMVYVKVLYGTDADGAEGGEYDGYAVITQQLTGNGAACALNKNTDGSYTATGKYPVWKSQPDGGSYFHKVILTGYTVNGAYIDCTGKNYISDDYMQCVNDKADRDMVIAIDSLDVPVTVFDANGGTIENGYILADTYGAEITAAEISAKVPEWINHTFEGWFDAAEGGTAVTALPALSSKTTLYAHWKKNQSAPTGITATKATSGTSKDASLSGVDDTMEYSADGGETWTSVATGATSIDNVGAGEILVRYAATETKNAGEAAAIAVGVKDNQSAPTGITVTGASSETAADGEISGLSADMEYRVYGGGEFTAVTESKLVNLKTGEYEIRYKATGDANAGETSVISVGYTITGNITWHYDYSYYPDGGGELQSGTVPDTISQRSRTARVELIKNGEVYRTVTVTASTIEAVSASGGYTFNDVPASVNGESAAYTVNIVPLVAEYDTDAVQTQTAQSYSVTAAGDDNRSVNIFYNPTPTDAPVVTLARNDIAVRTARVENGIKLTVDPMQSGVEKVNLLAAVYGNDNSLKSITVAPCEKGGDGKITAVLTEPQCAEGESYKLMLWDTEQSPLINAVKSGSGFFD